MKYAVVVGFNGEMTFKIDAENSTQAKLQVDAMLEKLIGWADVTNIEYAQAFSWDDFMDHLGKTVSKDLVEYYGNKETTSVPTH